MATWITNNFSVILEILSVIFGIIYVVLAAKNKISCWIYGIIGSLLSCWLFVEYAKLYAEAFLYLFYLFAGIYGWINWKKEKQESVVYQHSLKQHIIVIVLGVIFSISFYYLVTTVFTDAARPMIDSFTTVFSFIATYLTAKKWISNWLYWIVIDIVTTYLYFSRDLYIYSALMAGYSLMALYGYLEWKKLTTVESTSL